MRAAVPLTTSMLWSRVLLIEKKLSVWVFHTEEQTAHQFYRPSLHRCVKECVSDKDIRPCISAAKAFPKDFSAFCRTVCDEELGRKFASAPCATRNSANHCTGHAHNQREKCVCVCMIADCNRKKIWSGTQREADTKRDRERER
jgi:hypothetical protein